MVRHLLGASAAVLLVACGGGGGSSAPVSPAPPVVNPPPPPPPAAEPKTVLETKAEAALFLQQAGFATVAADVDAATGTDAADWVRAQFGRAPHGYRAQLGAVLSRDDAKNRDNTALIWQTMIDSDAQLRARTNFALSQLFVISDRDEFHRGYGLAEYMDILDRNAFGNYRDLLGEVTTSPMMGRYLTFLYNRKGDERTGRTPDENYAREILQLFSIGLVELNMDGTERLDGAGQPIETYTNDDIIGLARVFTGYALAGSSYQWRDRYDDTWERPMRMWDEQHSPLEKSFLGTTIPAGTGGEASVERALDTIFAHPNVPPFVARQLIQRFTASSPSSAYVQRVATAFANGRYTSENGTSFGTGARGDMQATLAAVLLDETVHDARLDANEGKLREPVLKFAQLARTYAKPATRRLVDGEWSFITDTSDPLSKLGQTPLKSPSVFNFYRPGYVAPSTETGAAALTAPELQIVNSSSAIGYANFVTDWINRTDDVWDGKLVPDFAEEVALAEDPQGLADRLDIKLLAGRMSADTRTAIVETLEALPVRDNQTERDRLSRAKLAVLIVALSPEYQVLD